MKYDKLTKNFKAFLIKESFETDLLNFIRNHPEGKSVSKDDLMSMVSKITPSSAPQQKNDSSSTQSENIKLSKILGYLPSPASDGSWRLALLRPENKRGVSVYQYGILENGEETVLILNESDVLDRIINLPDTYLKPVYNVTNEYAKRMSATSIKILEPATVRKDYEKISVRTKGKCEYV